MMETAQLDSRQDLLAGHDARGFLRSGIEWQTRMSRGFDRLLPRHFRVDGNRDFIDRLVPEYTRRGMLVYDVGGGKNPVVSRARKAEMALGTVGLDIDTNELASAPQGLYDETVCADIASYRGSGDADLVVCQALMEHVPNAERAVRGIASILKPGGRALLFVPGRNAVYARINRALPQGLKRRILFWLFPEMTRDHGFPAYYDRCTPAGLAGLARKYRLVPERTHVYFQSDYFRFCLPLHVLWRAWLLLFRSLAGDEAAETFTMVLRRET